MNINYAVVINVVIERKPCYTELLSEMHYCVDKTLFLHRLAGEIKHCSIAIVSERKPYSIVVVTETQHCSII